MKKVSAILLAALLLLSLAACGGGADMSDPQTNSSYTESDTSQAISAPESEVDTPQGEQTTSPTGKPHTTTTENGKSDDTASSVTTTAKADKTTTKILPTKVTTTTKAVRTTTTNKPTSATTTTTVAPKEEKTIICWGDSITEGAWLQTKDNYPYQLQQMLGDDYKVWNAGYGGDSSWAIGARQGAYKLTTKNAITFKKGVSTVIIGHRQTGMGLMLDDGTELTKMNVNMLTYSGTDFSIKLGVNPITIGGETYKLGLTYETETKPYTDGKYSVTLIRSNTANAVTIPAGTEVIFSNSDLAANDHCDIYLMGANDGLGNSPSSAQVAALVERYQKLVDSRENDRYLIIIPYWTKSYDAAFKKAFGRHAINLRELACEKGLTVEKLTPTKTDEAMIEAGNLPASLRYNNEGAAQVHLNKYGYHFLATVVYEQGKTLGYWK